MKVGLITIGNELLSGFTVDTNSSWIGKSLIEVGARISWHLTVKDDSSQIKMLGFDRINEPVYHDRF